MFDPYRKQQKTVNKPVKPPKDTLISILVDAPVGTRIETVCMLSSEAMLPSATGSLHGRNRRSVLGRIRKARKLQGFTARFGVFIGFLKSFRDHIWSGLGTRFSIS